MTRDLSPLIVRAGKAAFLTIEEERAALQAWQERKDRAAIDRLVCSHIRFVTKLAARYLKTGIPLADLVSEAVCALIHAAGKFDLTQPVRFSTYAAWWVKTDLDKLSLAQHSIVRMGMSNAQRGLFFKYGRLVTELMAGSPRTLEDAQRAIAERLGVPLCTVQKVAVRLLGDVSLNAPAGPDANAEFADTLADEGDGPDRLTEAALDGAKRIAALRLALARLPERDAEIVRRRCMTDSPETLEAIGSDLGISKERVRQIEVAALGRLRAILTTEHAAVFA